jgi:hypothetical protein
MGSLQILNEFKGRCALAALCTVAFFLAACGGSSGGGDSPTAPGLTLYDPLSGTTLDGQKWSSPLGSFGVASNAMVLSSQISNIESLTVDGLVYSTLANVNSGGQRVTTMTADITVPVASKSRTGSAEIRAVLRLQYQPSVNRLFLPGAANLNNLALEVGFNDTGSGLQAMRNIRHCDNANCTTRTQTGLAITDPLGFTIVANSAVAPAVYDTTYTVTVSLNETTGILSWTILGGTGAFSAGVTGTVDPANYLAANATWAAVGANPLIAGFLSAQAGTRILDPTPAGGSSGSISATFGSVQVGFDNAAPATFDDFSGTGTNSGPTELNVAKWIASGSGSSGQGSSAATPSGLTGHVQATNSASATGQNFQAMRFNNPTTFNALQADFTVSACINSGVGVGPAKSDRVFLSGTFYNDGTVGNQAASALGDVQALLIWDCLTNVSFFVIQRGSSVAGFTTISSANNAVPGLAAGNTHTLKMSWNPTSYAFSFQVDAGAPVVVDPTTVNPRMTTAAPFAKLANSPQKLLVGGVSVPAAVTSATASMDVKVNNVFTGP